MIIVRDIILSSSTLKTVSLLMPIVVLLLIVLLGFSIYRRIRRSINNAASFLPSLMGVTQMRKALDSSRPSMPRSLQSMEKLVLPEIQKDFPELNIESMRAAVAGDLKEFFNNENRAPEELSGNLLHYSKWWAGYLALKAGYGHPDGQSVYKVVIKDYNKEANRRHIIWQAGFYYNDGQNSGLSDRVDVVYTYELKEQVSDTGVVTVGMRCPSCGAPVEQVGSKVCRYCRTALNANWDMIWNLSSVQSA